MRKPKKVEKWEVKLVIEANFENVPDDDEISGMLQAITAVGWVEKATLTIPAPVHRDVSHLR